MPLQRRDPALAAAQRTVREAFEDLEKTVSPADSIDFQVTTLENVQKAALEIENQLAARQSLRNMRRLMPLFSGLGYYAQTIEVLCNGTSFMPWIWAPIKLILKISSDYVDAFEQIVKAYSRIGESLARFKVLSEAFRQNTEFQQSLAVFCADILRFHKEAYKLVRRSAWRVFFLTSWGRFQRRFDNILEDLARHEQQIDKEANACNIAEARNMRKALEEWRQESLSKVKKSEEEQTAHQLEAICNWLKKNETDQLLIFDRISTEGSNYSGTCSWVLENPTLSHWLRAGQSDITCIWLQGNLGTGKSIIAGQLINFLNASHNTLVAFHFCTYLYASSTQYDEILKSLLLQLVRANSDVAAHIYEGYVMERKSISMSALEYLLQTAMTALVEDLGRQRSIHMIIDGLDEVEADKQRRLINLMNGILKSRSSYGGTFKVLFSSRRSPLLEKALQKRPRVALSDEKDNLEHAICTYAEHRLKTQSNRLSQLGLQDRDFVEIGKSIAKRADGMFLWARLVLDYLTHNIFLSSQEIWDAINTLPRKLADFYERVLVQIMSNFDIRSVARMRSIFGWIAFAERPLRKFELRSALSFSTGNPMADELVPLYIFDMFMPLIEERLDSTLTFIHVSVKDYLQIPESKLPIVREKELHEHALASTTCLLSGLEVFNVGFRDYDRNLRVLKGLHGFHVYANEYWVDYVLDVFSSENSPAQLLNLTTILQELSTALEKLGGLSLASNKPSESAVSENRLDLIKEYPGLHKNAKIALQARSRKIFGSISGEEEQLLESPSVDLHPIRDLEGALANYQKTIRSLLPLSDFPRISKEDLESFKREHCTTVFTCRLSSCPRATIGFENDILRLEHEAAHAPRLKCPIPGCQYPPFISARALKSHDAMCHASPRGRKRIRNVDSMANMKMAFDAGSGIRKPDLGSRGNGMIEEDTGGATTRSKESSSQGAFESALDDFDFDSFLKNDFEGAFESALDDFDFDSFLNNDFDPASLPVPLRNRRVEFNAGKHYILR